MTFLIGGANSLAGGYDIDNSLRVERADSPKLSKTVSTATNTTKLTLSLWYKLGEPVDMGFLSKFADGNNRFHLRIMAAGHLLAYNNIAGTYHYKTTTAQFRDHSAWYHFMFVYDTDDSTAADRVKIYANGVRLTSFVNNTNPGDGEALKIASDTSNPLKVLCSNDEDAYLSGCVSDFYYIDGDNKAPTDFGEFDGSSGIWKPKEYTGGFGNNGFKLEFKQVGVGTASASTVGADTSGNNHHLTSANIAAIDVTTDTPTNNFSTLMPTKDITLSEGNLIMSHDREYWDGAHANIGLTSGKWYWEHRLDDADGDDRRIVGGIVSNPETYPHIYDGKGNTGDPAASGTYGTVSSASPSYMYTAWATNLIFDGTDTYNNNFVDIDDDDVLSFALDLDNNKFFIAVNGSYIAGDDGGTDGDPAAGTNETFDIVAASASRVYFPAAVVGWGTNTSSTTASFNFGNSSFAISSGNADTNGIGNFEYAVPDGFYSICTKNLAKYGG